MRVELFEDFISAGGVLDSEQHDDGRVGGHLGIRQRIRHAQKRNVFGSHGVELERSEGDVEEDVAQIRVRANQQAILLRVTLFRSQGFDEQVACVKEEPLWWNN